MSDISQDVSLEALPAGQKKALQRFTDGLWRLTGVVADAARSGARSAAERAHIELLRNLQGALLFGESVPFLDPIDYHPIGRPQDYGALLSGFREEKIPGHARSRALAVWHKASNDETRPVYVVFHGRRGHWCDVGFHRKKDVGKTYDRIYRARWLKALADSGAEVIAAHLSGQGASRRFGGRRGEYSFSKDVESLADYLEAQHIDPRRVVIAGESLGGAVGLMLAVEMTLRGHPPAGINLINSFTSMRDCVRALYSDRPPHMLAHIDKILKHTFESEKRLHALDATKTYLGLWHAPEDAAVPYAHQDRLKQTADGRGIPVETHNLMGEYMHPGYTDKDAIHTGWNAEKIVPAQNDMYARHRKAERAPAHAGNGYALAL